MDQVFDYKAKLASPKQLKSIKLHTTGYKADVDRIVITDKTMTFYKNGGREEVRIPYYAGNYVH